jgi:hypothetical protein
MLAEAVKDALGLVHPSRIVEIEKALRLFAD